MSVGKVWSGDRLGLGEGFEEKNTASPKGSLTGKAPSSLKLLEPEH